MWLMYYAAAEVATYIELFNKVGYELCPRRTQDQDKERDKVRSNKNTTKTKTTSSSDAGPSAQRDEKSKSWPANPNPKWRYDNSTQAYYYQRFITAEDGFMEEASRFKTCRRWHVEQDCPKPHTKTEMEAIISKAVGNKPKGSG